MVYYNLSVAVTCFRKEHGYDPIIAGDFNVDVDEDLGIDAGGTQYHIKQPARMKERWHSLKSTGWWSQNREASKNCKYLFDFNREHGYKVSNTYFWDSAKGDERCTWYHPRTKRGHVKDLILVPRMCMLSISRVYVDHSASVGNNDHSLVIAELRARSSKAWRLAGANAVEQMTRKSLTGQGPNGGPRSRGYRGKPPHSPQRPRGLNDGRSSNNIAWTLRNLNLMSEERVNLAQGLRIIAEEQNPPSLGEEFRTQIEDKFRDA